MSDDKKPKNPFEEMAEDFFGQAAQYIKDTMKDIKEGGTPPPDPKPDPKPDSKPKHWWFGETD